MNIPVVTPDFLTYKTCIHFLILILILKINENVNNIKDYENVYCLCALNFLKSSIFKKISFMFTYKIKIFAEILHLVLLKNVQI